MAPLETFRPSRSPATTAWRSRAAGRSRAILSTGVDFYAFHAGQLVSLDPASIVIAADNSGAETDPAKAVEATATWFFDPADKTALVVDYKIEARGASRVERAIWRLKGTSLVLSHGRVPPKVSAASGD